MNAHTTTSRVVVRTSTRFPERRHLYCRLLLQVTTRVLLNSMNLAIGIFCAVKIKIIWYCSCTVNHYFFTLLYFQTT